MDRLRGARACRKAIAVHPTNPEMVWAAGIGVRHYVSRTDDGGRTWKPADKGLVTRVRLLVSDRARARPPYTSSPVSEPFIRAPTTVRRSR